MRIALALAVLILLAVAAAHAAPPLVPDPHLTPGAVDPAVTQASIARTICVPGYTRRVRKVSADAKRAVFAAYRIAPTSDRFEVDHLISLELGGSNGARNLWPQSYTTRPWNAHVKDRLENRLHRLVCARALSLAAAQAAIAQDWRGAFARYVTVTVAKK
jgi:hypothetical protein